MEFSLKYEAQILEAFKQLGFSPRGNQVASINQVLTAFLDNDFKTIVLSAPTGTGKSIIGAVVAEVIHSVRYPEVFPGASFLLSPTNLLSEQYQRSFQDNRDRNDLRFRMIKGANNFECSALSTSTEPQTAESCALRLFNKENLTSVIDQHCSECAFDHQKQTRDRARHLITNYSYYFVDRMYLKRMVKRTVCVFDEAHLLNDLFTEHNAIFFSESRLKKYAEEVNEALTLGNTTIFKTFKTVGTDLKAGKITQDTYMTYLESLLEAYTIVCEAAQKVADQSIHNFSKYLSLTKLAKKYFGLGCKISDLITYGYEHSFEYKEPDPKVKGSEHEVSVKPIFVGSMFETLENADFNLLMSATLSEQYANRTLELPNSTVIKLEPTFPRENKKIVFYNPQNLNYNSLKNPEIINRLKKTCADIVKYHIKKNERGIVLTPSFVLNEMMTDGLKNCGVTLFEHKRGEALSTLVKAFRAHEGLAVMITPSGFEGLDLAGDLSRFQVLVKAPFGSLGDARTKEILNRYPDIYQLTTIMKIVQGAGRSVRSEDDFATTYILDTNVQRLWTSKEMVWGNEFETTYKGFLE